MSLRVGCSWDSIAVEAWEDESATRTDRAELKLRGYGGARCGLDGQPRVNEWTAEGDCPYVEVAAGSVRNSVTDSQTERLAN